MQLKDQVIVVTGAFGALGRAVCAQCLTEGARVVALDRAETNAAAAHAYRLDIGGVDLTDAAQTGAAIERAIARFAQIDGLVNVAGGFTWQTVADGSAADWQSMYALNVATAVVTTQAALPHLLQRQTARIVNIGANAALKGSAGMGPYTASKAAVLRLTESLADELKDKGVNVNAVLPSIIDTVQNRADMPKAEHDRWVTPEALAEVIVFLLGPGARAITGALIPVTGRV
ncbi:SDR family NAD(P)-dependent oxidoreductase [Pseudoxanthomonas sp. CAU 1598]|uniref:SDR family NAD(P)-dependent oxidoreductase n=2 Tax=Pseudomarimonas arenosa TaxID=2774145 RepID=A0AAW3ZRT4_9GAMM|nr:SDR family NAD(P)-dependent oxidoreductase [Pseudomarimonas arenosa]